MMTIVIADDTPAMFGSWSIYSQSKNFLSLNILNVNIISCLSVCILTNLVSTNHLGTRIVRVRPMAV